MKPKMLSLQFSFAHSSEIWSITVEAMIKLAARMCFTIVGNVPVFTNHDAEVPPGIGSQPDYWRT